jgi:hypothetical protein
MYSRRAPKVVEFQVSYQHIRLLVLDGLQTLKRSYFLQLINSSIGSLLPHSLFFNHLKHFLFLANFYVLTLLPLVHVEYVIQLLEFSNLSLIVLAPFSCPQDLL